MNYGDRGIRYFLLKISGCPWKNSPPKSEGASLDLTAFDGIFFSPLTLVSRLEFTGLCRFWGQGRVFFISLSLAFSGAWTTNAALTIGEWMNAGSFLAASKTVFLYLTFPFTVSRGNLGKRNPCQKDAILIFHEFSLSSRLLSKWILLSYLLMET